MGEKESVMKKNKIITSITGLFLLVIILYSLISQNNKTNAISNPFFYLGTIIDITLYDTDNQAYLEEVKDLIQEYDQLFDRNNEKSDLYKLNALKSYTVNKSTYEVVETALEYSRLTQGYFDITINPIVDLWKIGTDDENIPPPKAIEDALLSVGYDHVLLKDDNLISLINDASLDLGGIAKGFIADEIVGVLEAKDIKRALINLGGNIYAYGNSPDGGPWSIGIRHPEEKRNGSILKVMLENKSVVTSGVTERFFIVNDQRYHHILDPFTGYPIDNNILSVTIISDNSMIGDALATGMFALGVEEAFKTLKQLKDVQMIIVTTDKNIYYSKTLEDKIEIFDPSYKGIKK